MTLACFSAFAGGDTVVAVKEAIFRLIARSASKQTWGILKWAPKTGPQAKVHKGAVRQACGGAVRWPRNSGRPPVADQGRAQSPGCTLFFPFRGLTIGANHSARRVDAVQRRARPHSLGQRAGVYGPCCARVACAGGGKEALHRAWVPVRERLHREFQWEFEVRAVGQGGPLYVARGACVDGALLADYNQIRPHSSLGYRPPAPETLLPADPVPVLVGLT